MFVKISKCNILETVRLEKVLLNISITMVLSRSLLRAYHRLILKSNLGYSKNIMCIDSDTVIVYAFALPNALGMI